MKRGLCRQRQKGRKQAGCHCEDGLGSERLISWGNLGAGSTVWPLPSHGWDPGPCRTFWREWLAIYTCPVASAAKLCPKAGFSLLLSASSPLLACPRSSSQLLLAQTSVTVMALFVLYAISFPGSLHLTAFSWLPPVFVSATHNWVFLTSLSRHPLW